MIKNIIGYLLVLFSAFLFSVFYFRWFSWVLLLIVAAVPAVSLLFSLPFMIAARRGGAIMVISETAEPGESLALTLKGEKAVYCPRLIARINVRNSFSDFQKRIKIKYSGSLRSGCVTKLSEPFEHCGVVRFTAESCRVYDFLGLFFIPLKKINPIAVTVIPKPEEPSLLPDDERIGVVGYEKKNGYSDLYELRDFRDGDSPRLIHWKATAKHDKLISREPVEPVLSGFVIRPVWGGDAFDNDDILARLLYCGDFLLERGGSFYCEHRGECFPVNSSESLWEYLGYLFGGAKPQCEAPARPCTVYLIHRNGEEVSG